MMTRQLQDPDLPARFPMELAAARDEHGEALALVRCNDGSIWLDTGNATVPWRRLAAIPEPTAEEVEAAEQEERERHARHVAARIGLIRAATEWAARKEAERLAPVRPWWRW
jgi:hypothetical protein